MKPRVFLVLAIALACLCPVAAFAWPGWVVFNFQADPNDPLGGTGTGWFEVSSWVVPEDGPRADIPVWFPFGNIDFWWQGQHWTEQNAVIGELAFDYRLPIVFDERLYEWTLCGGLEQDFLGGNTLAHEFDFSMVAKGGPFNIGATYSASMRYVNPSTPGGQYYLATGSFTITDQDPGPAPHASEPASLVLTALGIAAAARGRRQATRWPGTPLV